MAFQDEDVRLGDQCLRLLRLQSQVRPVNGPTKEGRWKWEAASMQRGMWHSDRVGWTDQVVDQLVQAYCGLYWLGHWWRAGGAIARI